MASCLQAGTASASIDLSSVVEHGSIALPPALQREPVSRREAGAVVEHDRLLWRHVSHQPVDRPHGRPYRDVYETAVEARLASNGLGFGEDVLRCDVIAVRVDDLEHEGSPSSGHVRVGNVDECDGTS